MISPEQFIKDYNTLIDRMAQANNPAWFWLTDLASKNRLSCPLADDLEALSQGKSLRSTYPLWTGIKRRFGYFRHAWQAWQMRSRSRSLLKRIPAKQQVRVLKTFVYPHSFTSNGEYRDVFWGELANQLKAKGDFFILATMLGDTSSTLEQIKKSQWPIIPIEAFLRKRDIVVLCLQLFWVQLRVPSDLSWQNHPIANHLKNILASTANGLQWFQALHAPAILGVLEKAHVGRMYMTFENYPWERAFIRLLRERSSHTKIYGYQHTVVPQAFLNYYPCKEEIKARLYPDRILTTGEESAKAIRRFGETYPVEVKGTCAFRFPELSRLPLANRTEIKHVLIALEGSMVCLPLLKRILSELSSVPQLMFRVRTHPLLPIEKIREKIGDKAGDWSRLIVSSGSLKDDLQWSQAVIYYSTTVSLEAAMMGKVLIHVPIETILSFNPLHECPGLVYQLNKEMSLAHILTQVKSIPDQVFVQKQEQARVYVQQYLSEITPQALKAFDI